MTLERMSLRMPIIRVIEWPIPDRVRSRIDDSIYPLAAGEGRLSPCEAERCLTRVQELGFPMPTQVNLVQARTTHTAGQETGGMCLYIFAWSDSPEFLHRIFWHEYGHTIHKVCLHGDRIQPYKSLRFPHGISDSALIGANGLGEIFAEDFRFLFGTPEAKVQEHTRKMYVSDIGFSLPESLQRTLPAREGMTFAQLHNALRKVVIDAVQEKTGEGVLPFSDIKGHWAEADIVEAAKAGLLRGDPDGRFRPDDKVTRAELAAVAARLLRRA